MKVCIYGLVHNIGDRAQLWMDHIQDATYVVLGDVGSTDFSHGRLAQHGARVHQLAINPWRYDVARNTLLSLIPEDADVTIALDFNQTLSNNWYDCLRRNWIKGTTKLVCPQKYHDSRVASSSRIHARTGYYWKRPVYEQLSFMQTEQIVYTNDILITDDFNFEHGNTHDLLITGFAENPNDNELGWRLGASYSGKGQWQKAIDTHIQSIKAGDSQLYRSESMVYLSGLDHTNLSNWLKKSVLECDWRRETWHEVACYYFRQHEWELCYAHSTTALSLGCTRVHPEVDEQAIKAELYDMSAMSAWKCGMMEKALLCAESASNLAPKDARLQNNLITIRNIIANRK